VVFFNALINTLHNWCQYLNIYINQYIDGYCSVLFKRSVKSADNFTVFYNKSDTWLKFEAILFTSVRCNIFWRNA